MRSSTAKFNRWFGAAGLLVAGLFLSGCGHLYYADPNPSQPYAFPGSTPNRAAPTASSSVGSQSVAYQPGSVQPVLPANPALPSGQNTLVAVPPSTGVPPPPGNPPVPGPSDNAGGSSLLRVGDSVSITFSDTPQAILAAPLVTTVGEDGRITGLPLGVTVQAAGKTPAQVQEDIQKAYVPRYYRNLTANVKSDLRFYYVGGEVRLPNRQQYAGDMTVLRAIDTAGGFTDFAKRSKIELRRANGQSFTIDANDARKHPKLDLPVYPNDQVWVPKKGPWGF